MTRVYSLTNLEIDLAVAYLQGIEVEVFKHHEHDPRAEITEGTAAQKFDFDPEGPANYFSRDHRNMWRFYEPSKDWSIAGPIIQTERITISHSFETDKEEYSWSFYTDNAICECDGTTATEAAMRSYIFRHLGDKIDVYNLPPRPRTAIVRVSGFRSMEIAFNPTEGDYLDVAEHVVVAQTTAEAERLAKMDFPEYEQVDAYFLRWA